MGQNGAMTMSHTPQRLKSSRQGTVNSDPKGGEITKKGTRRVVLGGGFPLPAGLNSNLAVQTRVWEK